MSESNSFCVKCGANLGLGNNFCPKCGSSANSDESPQRTIRKRRISKESANYWYLLPIFLNIVGGIIAYFILRDPDRRKARNCLFIGTILFIFYVIIFLSVGVSFNNFVEETERKVEINRENIRDDNSGTTVGELLEKYGFGSDSYVEESTNPDTNSNLDVKTQDTGKILNLPHTWTGNNYEYTLLELRDGYIRSGIDYYKYEIFSSCQNLLKTSNSGGFYPVFNAKLVTSEGNTWDLEFPEHLNRCRGTFDPQQTKLSSGSFFPIPTPDEKPEFLLVGDLTFDVRGTGLE